MRSTFLSLIVAPIIFALLLFSTTASSIAAEPAQKSLADQPARPSPEWLTQGVIYQIWPRSFTPEGKIAAAAKRLPEVAKLGANIAYLCPIFVQDDDMRPEFWSPRQCASGTNNPRNPYRIADYEHVDPEYGTDADLREFVKTAHQLKLRVMLDIVYFHCGPAAKLVQEHPEFFQKDKDGNISTGDWRFPVFNFDNPQVCEYFVNNMVYLIKEFDIDGFRCDVADRIPLSFWEQARKRLDAIRPGIVILAEGCRRPADQLFAFDVDYGFTWYHVSRKVFTQGQPASAFRETWERTVKSWPRGSRFMRYTENHDTVNDLHRADVLFGKRGTKTLTVINFAIDGVPFIYNGQEIGDTNVQSIYARWPIRWEAACLPGARETFKFYQKLCQLRRTDPALSAGAVVWLDNDQPDAIVSFLRRAGDAQIVCVANVSNRLVTAKITLPDGAAKTFKPLLAEAAKMTSADGKLSVTFTGQGYFLGKTP